MGKKRKVRGRWPRSEPVEVRWVDTMGTSGWHSVAEGRSDPEIVSVGHLIERTRTHVLLAAHSCHYRPGDYTQIPIEVVRRVRRLK